MNKFFFFCLILIVASISSVQTILAQSPVPEGAKVDKIASGYQFVEGPLWREPGYLIFSDINGNTIYKWSPVDGKEIYYKPSGNSNGLDADLQGRVLMAQHGKRQIARLEEDGSETALATHYDSKRLNSPNDIAVKSDGSIYFTDPPYGISSNQEELGFYGIFRLTPDGELILLDDTLIRPNGIVFSPDETKLYVDDTQTGRIYVWDVQEDFTIANKKVLATMTGNGSADGMDIDSNGNIYCSGPGGVWIFTPTGTVLDKIPVSESVTNVTWGDADRKALYITAGTSIYSIRLNASGLQSGIKTPAKSQVPENIQLFANYPNPFNPVTTVTFNLAKSEHVTVQVFNTQGKLVRILADDNYVQGSHNLVWNALDEKGVQVASGVYYCRIIAGESGKTLKMLLLR